MTVRIKRKQSAFTIVELLMVIVVIAVLATISLVGYRGVQDRTRDSRRLNDTQSITGALIAYRAEKGTYPTPSYNGPGGWESSSISPQQFIQELKTNGILSSVPVDPVNSSSKEYRYYVYPAGNAGCDAAKGSYYVLGVLDMESSGRPHPKSPGWSCPDRNWQTEFDWVTGKFLE